MNNEELDRSVDDDDVNGKSQDLVQCPACLRRMQPSVFAKHPNVCRENPSQKRHRKIFDMTQYRAIKAGDKVLPVRKVSPINPDKSSANTNYNINTRPSQTRSAKRDRRSDAFVPPIISKFCCPTCKRTFCEKAYDRHVAFCSSKVKQVQQPPSEQTLMARLKLDRRVKFTSHSNRVCATLSQTSPVIVTSNQPTVSTPPAAKAPSKPKPSLTAETLCFVSVRKKHSDALARCPWCSKPYLPNCIHYCRNSKEMFSIHSK